MYIYTLNKNFPIWVGDSSFNSQRPPNKNTITKQENTLFFFFLIVGPVDQDIPQTLQTNAIALDYSSRAIPEGYPSVPFAEDTMHFRNRARDV